MERLELFVLAHPTLNDLAPRDFIRIAERTGYDAINLRLIPLDPNTAAANIFNDRALLRATADALAASPLVLLDIEVIRIEPDTVAAQFEAMFAAGALLGARYAVAIAMDTEEARVAQRLAELCAVAKPHGLTVVLEFMMRGGIRTLDAAHRIVRATGADNVGILVDALHFYRSGAKLSDLATIDPALLPYMQINDVRDFAALRQATPPETVVWKKTLPGTGDLALAELLAALPPGIPISIEVPGTPGASLEEAEGYAAEALRRTRSVLAEPSARH
jgi:sugar phosphate isomerase/epimerase